MTNYKLVPTMEQMIAASRYKKRQYWEYGVLCTCCERKIGCQLVDKEINQ